ncbi:hypothetical protein BJ508DRAFT_90943 [Ascobolus immersus RN42]|uniref:Uncharacterized protein n=1 Tax=Ascobolus immersus RN42 TaxID=1160509 RepID=A0A3N4ICG4_ASCIM|nr:hypothetical protein BJ508DRAFT_90943 [Ascobolus immersus RN42]
MLPKASMEALAKVGITDPVEQLLHQTFNVTYYDHDLKELVQLPVSMAAVDAHNRIYNMRTGSFGVQFGGALMLLILLFIVTSSQRRKRAVFMINVVGLILLAVRGILQMNFVNSAWASFYAIFTDDYQFVAQHNTNTSMFMNIVNILIILVIELGLVFQIRTIFFTSPTYRRVFTLIGVVIGLGVMASQCLIAALQMMNTLHDMTFSYFNRSMRWTRVTFAASVMYYTALLVGKLGYTLWIQRRMSLQKFGPLQIIFIMSCQAMVVPGVLVSLEAGNFEKFAGIGTLGQAAVIFSLPLSAIWAASVQDLTPLGSADSKGRAIPLDQSFLNPTTQGSTMNGSIDRMEREKNAAQSTFAEKNV